ncbi:hypothetical protein L2E82_42316 [Cichorium intybus]|uniref:Uncharacterized protein n=1 Tax=Cichorium intybus TaxID=13427 RepID=A0ACB8ZMA6_CICIN|nr:hypothetical protein L2E82_42316 [Cichorium intybus]
MKDRIKLLELKETALEISEASFLEKEKDLQQKIEELEKRLEVLDQDTENPQVSTTENSNPTIISDDAIKPEINKTEDQEIFFLIDVVMMPIQHPRTQLTMSDLVVAPQHDYYALTRHAQEQVPKFFRKYITPNEPPKKNVVLTVGSLHQVYSSGLRGAAIAWHDEFAPL